MINIFKKIFLPKNDVHYLPLDQEIVDAYQNFRPQGKQKHLCMAPFRSLYFGHFGKVNVCCYNRNYSVGTYPEQSIKEIWFGEKLAVLRDYIKHNDLSLGCKGCYHHLKSGNFDAAKPHGFDFFMKNWKNYPASMEFELSNTCNLECIMCNGDFSSSIRKNREKKAPLTSAYDQNFVHQLAPFIPYLQQASFYGGEPFLVDIYYDIWERMADINPDINIMVQTNATILNQKVKNLLERTKFTINVSIDSLDKENYEYIRKNARFEVVMKNIEYFRDYCQRKNTNFFISACAMPQNWREFPDFIHFCNQRDIQVYFHHVIGPAENALGMLEAAELEVIYQELDKHQFTANTPIEKKNKEHFEGLVQQIKYWAQRAEKAALKKEASQTTKSSVIVKTNQDLQNILHHYVNTLAIKEDIKRSKNEAISRKLEQLQVEMEDDNIEVLTSHLDWDDPLILEHISKIIIDMPLSEIMNLVRKKAEKSN